MGTTNINFFCSFGPQGQKDVADNLYSSQVEETFSKEVVADFLKWAEAQKRTEDLVNGFSALFCTENLPSSVDGIRENVVYLKAGEGWGATAPYLLKIAEGARRTSAFCLGGRKALLDKMSADGKFADIFGKKKSS